MIVAAGAAAVLAITSQVLARAPAPLVPAALVEDVKSVTADVEFMDYVGRGQVIKLGPRDLLVLSYLKSCEHETITGGTVTVGAERSEIKDGQVVRNKVPCNGGKMQLTSKQASQSAATAFRLQSAEGLSVLYSRTPMVQLPKVLAREDRNLLIERTDRRSERHDFKVDDASAAAGFFDLAKVRVSLSRGATYVARIGDREVNFRIDAKARSGPTSVVSRLLRFQ
jgi:hypothetical protein